MTEAGALVAKIAEYIASVIVNESIPYLKQYHHFVRLIRISVLLSAHTKYLARDSGRHVISEFSSF